MIIVVMGVAGSGKTTVGTKLAAVLHCAFLEGDGLHSQANVEKMSHGIPLTDADRAPWLTAIHKRMCDAFTAGESLVVACSALKRAYRAKLAEGLPVTCVYLKGSADLIRSRLKHRAHHFMKANMLASQFDDLEEPSDAIVVDIAQPPDAIVERILAGVSHLTAAGGSTPPQPTGNA
jgi:gluconokinase